MRAFAITDVGLSRNMNQDSIYCSEKPIGNLPNLFIVADGMGGHKAGDMASRYTVEQFIENVIQDKSNNPITIIGNAIKKVNEQLVIKASESEDYQGMGTTLVVATISEGLLHIANVGDSRLYVLGEQMKQVTRDHSLVEEMVLLGEIERKDARMHEKKNIITRAIGGSNSVMADFFEIELGKKDRIIMCSDGLTNMIDDDEMRIIVNNSSDIEDAAKKLVERANNNGGKDNISVIIIEP